MKNAIDIVPPRVLPLAKRARNINVGINSRHFLWEALYSVLQKKCPEYKNREQTCKLDKLKQFRNEGVTTIQQRVHFVYIVPEGKGCTRWINRLATRTNLYPPLYRFANEAFIDWPSPTYAPFSITRELAQSLKTRYRVRLYDWYETAACNIKPQDILLFHPKPDYTAVPTDNVLWTDFDHDSIGWKTLSRFPNCKSFIIVPYTHEDQNGWLNSFLERSNGNLIAICGDYWTKNWESSPYRTKVKRLLQVNMCIDASSYPTIKHSFNPKGKRRFLYIGHTAYYKNTEQLEKIAEQYPQFDGAHIGFGKIRGWRKVADKVDFNSNTMRQLAEQFDIFVNCSTADAQATTVLEQMCFGFAIACTPQSGYTYPSIVALDTHDTEFNCHQLDELQYADQDELLRRGRENRLLAQRNHAWEDFGERILNFIEK